MGSSLCVWLARINTANVHTGLTNMVVLRYAALLLLVAAVGVRAHGGELDPGSPDDSNYLRTKVASCNKWQAAGSGADAVDVKVSARGGRKGQQQSRGVARVPPAAAAHVLGGGGEGRQR
jgi:hypothetical protein